MVTPVSRYLTSDGQEFQDEGDALAHEAALENKERIEAFVDKHYPKPENGKPGPARAIVAKALAIWIAEQGR